MVLSSHKLPITTFLYRTIQPVILSSSFGTFTKKNHNFSEKVITNIVALCLLTEHFLYNDYEFSSDSVSLSRDSSVFFFRRVRRIAKSDC